MITLEITPEVASKQALTVYEQAKQIIVIDNVTMSQADQLIKDMRAVRKEISAAFDPIISKAYQAHKEAKLQKDKAEQPLIDAENFLKPQIKRYLDLQEAKRIAEENRLRIEAQIAEENRRLAEAAQLEAEGLKAEAEAILDTPAPIVMPTVEKTTPKADMRLYRKVWKFEVTDFAKLPDQYKMPNDSAIGQVVRALKEKTKIPGVRIWQE